MKIHRKETKLLLLHEPDICVQESTIIAAIDRINGAKLLEEIHRHGKPLFCTQNVVAAAAKAKYGPNTLTVVLHQHRDAKISQSMVMTAMRARFGAALVSIMLQHDHTIIIEEHLIAAALNPYDPIIIFEFLHSKGKLGTPESTTRALDASPAKRRKISYRSPPRVSTKVVIAAFCNPDEAVKLKLLELFVGWDIMAQADFDELLYDALFTIDSSPPSSPETDSHSPSSSET